MVPYDLITFEALW